MSLPKQWLGTPKEEISRTSTMVVTSEEFKSFNGKRFKPTILQDTLSSQISNIKHTNPFYENLETRLHDLESTYSDKELKQTSPQKICGLQLYSNDSYIEPDPNDEQVPLDATKVLMRMTCPGLRFVRLMYTMGNDSLAIQPNKKRDYPHGFGSYILTSPNNYKIQHVLLSDPEFEETPQEKKAKETNEAPTDLNHFEVNLTQTFKTVVTELNPYHPDKKPRQDTFYTFVNPLKFDPATIHMWETFSKSWKTEVQENQDEMNEWLYENDEKYTNSCKVMRDARYHTLIDLIEKPESAKTPEAKETRSLLLKMTHEERVIYINSEIQNIHMNPFTKMARLRATHLGYLTTPTSTFGSMLIDLIKSYVPSVILLNFSTLLECEAKEKRLIAARRLVNSRVVEESK
ncbi:MAG: hypothetical protein ACTSUE_06070 [Promethearchaeota archaeon]